MTVNVAEPGAVTEPGLTEAPRAEDALSATAPLNPATLPTLIVVVPEFPGARVRLVGFDARVKSCAVTVTGTVALWVTIGEVEVLCAVTVTVYVPDGPLTVRIVLTVPSGGRNTNVSAVVADSAPVAVVETVMKSVKPPKLVKVMVDIPLTPGGVEIDAGADVMPKSVRFEKVALSRVSLSPTPLPLDMVTAIRLTLMPGVLDRVL